MFSKRFFTIGLSVLSLIAFASEFSAASPAVVISRNSARPGRHGPHPPQRRVIVRTKPVVVKPTPRIISPPVVVKPGPVVVHKPVIAAPHHKHYVFVRPPRIVYTTPGVVVASRPSDRVEIWITNDNGSKTLVVLTKDGPNFRGPKGEWYSSMPTEAQLKVLYGLGNKNTDLTVWITNNNGSLSPVKLIRRGSGYVGPGGEFYSVMPTEEQLKVLYGIGGKAVEPDSVVIWLNNADGVKAPVVLKKKAGKYIGPKGEQYAALPTEEQLRAVYGSPIEPTPQFRTIWIETEAGVKVPVTIVKEGDAYVGPMGENYDEFPSADQLRALYGDATGKNAEIVLTVVDDDGSEVPVTLQKQGNKFVGPEGERYDRMPSADELLERYGNKSVGGTGVEEVTVMVTNADGTKSAVVLNKEGDKYIGPKGEYYLEKPGPEQLKGAYGK